MLVKAPAKRMSAEEACAHPWITKPRPKPLPPSTGGVEPVAKAEEMMERQVEAGSTGAPAAAAAGDQSTALDPDVVRRLRRFAVRTHRAER